MKSKTLLFSAVIATLCMSNSFADQTLFSKDSLKIGFGGELNALGGYRTGKPAKIPVSEHNKNLAIDTLASVHASIKFPKFHGWDYGAQIGLKTTTNNDFPAGQDVLDRTYIYAENKEVGRIELGTRQSAANAMKINAGTIAVGSYGVDGLWYHFLSIGSTKELDDSNFIDCPNLAISEGIHENGRHEKYRKITIYTPLISGFKLGFSYSPDGSNRGSVASFPYSPPTEYVKYRAKNIVAAGLTWEHKTGKEEIKASVVGEYAKYQPTVQVNELALDYHKYQAISVGGSYKYDKVSIAASYGNHFKSKFAKDVPVSNSYVYSVGVSYDFDGHGAASFGYLFSSKNKNTLNLTSVDVEYNLAPGITPYAGVTYMHAHQKRAYTIGEPVTAAANNGPKIANTNSKNHGAAFILGTRVVF